ncbi:MAG TPA: hypothetical protein VN285_09205 [Candidatus Deferrimicrobium sp.]|nr:hypothetical protein [Candidatus Deferrimicrobium sp.]
MKKLLAAMAFLALLVGVSYVSFRRQEGQASAAYERGKKEGAAKVEEYRHQFDSLSKASEDRAAEIGRAVWEREIAYQHAVNSLSVAASAAQLREDSLRAELQKSKPTARQAETSTGAAATKNPKHEEILSYYKSRYQKLPKDLSPYELQVALTEIRNETARKFAITRKDLDSIRSSSMLDY